MQKNLFNKTIHEFTVKDGIKLYFIAQLVTSVVQALKQSNFKYTPNEVVIKKGKTD